MMMIFRGAYLETHRRHQMQTYLFSNKQVWKRIWVMYIHEKNRHKYKIHLDEILLTTKLC